MKGSVVKPTQPISAGVEKCGYGVGRCEGERAVVEKGLVERVPISVKDSLDEPTAMINVLLQVWGGVGNGVWRGKEGCGAGSIGGCTGLLPAHVRLPCSHPLGLQGITLTSLPRRTSAA